MLFPNFPKSAFFRCLPFRSPYWLHLEFDGRAPWDAPLRARGRLFEIPSQIGSVYAFLRGPPIFGNSKPNKKRLRVFAHGAESADLHHWVTRSRSRTGSRLTAPLAKRARPKFQALRAEDLGLSWS